MMAQCVVDYKKKFIDVFLGLPGNVNDLRVLCQFGLYKKVQYNGCLGLKRLFKMNLHLIFWMTRDTH